MAVIVLNSCIGCEACIAQCPHDALSLNAEGKISVDGKKCDECRECIKSCPVSAISLPEKENIAKSKKQDLQTEVPKTNANANIAAVEEKKAASPESCAKPVQKDHNGGVLVFAEQLEGKIAGVALELVGAAKKLAEKLGVQVCAVLLGDGVEAIIPVLFEHGADKVYVFDNPLYHFYRTESYTKACCYLANKYKPEIFLVGATTSGRDLAGALATTMRTGLTADCTGLDIDMDKRLLLASRPAFGGNIMATIVCENHLPQMATVRPRVMPTPEPVSGRKGELIREEVEIEEDELRTSVLKIVKEQSDNIKLEDAKIIVSGGRGVQNEQGFALLGELARAVGGVLAGSRGAVEKGLVEHKRQVGQTGQTVAPKLYFAVGISGAIQHIVGMQGSETIVAINTDPQCPMMKLATYGIQGDAFEVLPVLIEEFKRELAHKEVVAVG
ncbi:MAG: 4Fe-4S dicluster domain-containing protein [Ruminiclostridium sp.]|nr:4Fe-4S dicluster domain-containing protein [Ruminiclostridium sp.]